MEEGERTPSESELDISVGESESELSIVSTKEGDKGIWLDANIMHLEPGSLHVKVEGIQTWVCSISVNNHRIRHYRACMRWEGGMTENSMGAPTTWTAFEVPVEKEIHLLTFWARTWGRSLTSNSMLIWMRNKGR